MKIDLKNFDYRALWARVKMLWLQPAEAWKVIETEHKEQVFTEFLYPMIGFCGMTALIGSILDTGFMSITESLGNCCMLGLSLLGGFYVSTFFITKLNERILNVDMEPSLVRQFTAYSMVVILSLYVFKGLWSVPLVHWILQFYTAFVVYEGARVYLNVKEEKLRLYTLTVTATILISPVLVTFVLNKLISFLG